MFQRSESEIMEPRWRKFFTEYGEEFERIDFKSSYKPGEYNKDGLMHFVFDEPADEHGIKRRIMILGNVAELYEEGIYCFHEHVALGLNNHFIGIDVAGLDCGGTGGSISLDAYFHFLAIGREHFARLKELGKIFGENYYEFPRSEPGENVRLEPIDLGAFVKHAGEEKEKHKDIVLEIEEGAKELVKGLGFRNLEVVWSIPFISDRSRHRYGEENWDVAYMLGTELVLKRKYFDGIIEEQRHDMRIMDMLCVLEKKKFRNGLKEKIPHQVIFCPEEKKKEILSDEVYELFQKEEEWERKQEQI